MTDPALVADKHIALMWSVDISPTEREAVTLQEWRPTARGVAATRTHLLGTGDWRSTLFEIEHELHTTRAGARLILAHNHTHGDPTPSEQDQKTTARVIRIARRYGLSIHDHIVIAPTLESSADIPTVSIRDRFPELWTTGEPR